MENQRKKEGKKSGNELKEVKDGKSSKVRTETQTESKDGQGRFKEVSYLNRQGIKQGCNIHKLCTSCVPSTTSPPPPPLPFGLDSIRKMKTKSLD